MSSACVWHTCSGGWEPWTPFMVRWVPSLVSFRSKLFTLVLYVTCVCVGGGGGGACVRVGESVNAWMCVGLCTCVQVCVCWWVSECRDAILHLQFVYTNLFHGSAFTFTWSSVYWCKMQCSGVMECAITKHVEVTCGTGSLYIKVIADVLWIVVVALVRFL